MAAVMIEIVVVLEIVAVVVVDLVTVVPEVASETAVGIAEEVDLTIAAEKEAIIVVTVEIAVEEVVDLEGVMINVMSVVVVEVILKEVGVNLLLVRRFLNIQHYNIRNFTKSTTKPLKNRFSLINQSRQFEPNLNPNLKLFPLCKVIFILVLA